VSWSSGYTISSLTTNGANGTNGSPGTPGINGLQTARPTVYQWSITIPASPVGTSTFTWASNSFTPDPSGWSQTITSAPSAGYTLWAATVNISDTATATTTSINWGLSAIVASGYAGTNGANGSPGTPGTNGTRTAILEMYQWAVSAPTSFPSGASTYTWATGQFTAPPTTNGWSITPPAAVLGQTLWICRTVYADSNTTATTSITWSASAAYAAGASGTNGSNGSPGADGANGARTAILEVYRWAATTPTTFPSGTSTYTWASGAFTAPSTANGWSLLPGASSAGFTLYGCQVSYVDNLTTATSTVTWTTSTAYAIGAAGANGANGTNGTNGANGANGIDGLSSRICYAKSTSSSLNPTPATYTTTGAGAFPPTNTWGGSETWQATPPALTAGEALFQSDGIYNPATSQTVWNVPYLSNLKVGSLSAISANLGTITAGDISGTSVTVNSTGYIRSGQTAYNTGTGFWMGQVGGVPKFSIGNPSGNYMLWDGSNLIIKTGAANGVTYTDDATVITPSSAISYVQFFSNGRTAGGNEGYQQNWYDTTTTGIGSSYWIRFLRSAEITTSGVTINGTVGAWTSLATDQSIGITRSLLGFASKTFVYQISSTSSGSNIVGSGTVVVTVQVDN
jgi:hypothetical protein